MKACWLSHCRGAMRLHNYPADNSSLITGVKKCFCSQAETSHSLDCLQLSAGCIVLNTQCRMPRLDATQWNTRASTEAHVCNRDDLFHHHSLCTMSMHPSETFVNCCETLQVNVSLLTSSVISDKQDLCCLLTGFDCKKTRQRYHIWIDLTSLSWTRFYILHNLIGTVLLCLCLSLV